MSSFQMASLSPGAGEKAISSTKATSLLLNVAISLPGPPIFGMATMIFDLVKPKTSQHRVLSAKFGWSGLFVGPASFRVPD